MKPGAERGDAGCGEIVQHVGMRLVQLARRRVVAIAFFGDGQR